MATASDISGLRMTMGVMEGGGVWGGGGVRHGGGGLLLNGGWFLKFWVVQHTHGVPPLANLLSQVVLDPSLIPSSTDAPLASPLLSWKDTVR